MKKNSKLFFYSIPLIVIIASMYAFMDESQIGKETTTPQPIQETAPEKVSTTTNNVSFEWNYSSYEKDQIPKTDISLVAKYENGTSTKKFIDTIEGTCNEYSERDKDVYTNSQMIICYYAGFGRYYKVVQNGNEFMVQRKEFEEASPDYNPPIAPFQTIVRF